MSKKGLRRSAALAAAWVSVSTAYAAPPNVNYKLIFADEFNGNTLDPIKWGYNYPSFFPNNGHTHNSQAYWEASQDIVANGTLDLQGINQVDPNAPANYSYGGQSLPLNYTSGAINSYNTFQFGPNFSDSSSNIYVEARMKMPSTNGSWPALWMLQSGWPPEIDIMEFPINTTSSDTTVNSTNQYSATWHYGSGSNPLSAGSLVDHGSSTNFTAGFHTFGLNWNTGTLSFYLDGNDIFNTTASVSQATQMYLLLDNAIGGWPGTPPAGATFPSNFMVDYVRVYETHPQVNGVATSSTSTWQTNGGGSWDTSGNWNGIVPSFGDQIAQFVPVGSSPTSAVAWTGLRTSGGLVFGDPSNVTPMTTTYTIGQSGGELEFANSSGTALIHAVSTCQADQFISSTVDLFNNTTIQNDMPSNSIVVNGGIMDASNLNKTGTGLVVLGGNNTFSGTLFAGNGKTSGGNADGALQITTAAAVGGNTLIDLSDNNSAYAYFQLNGTSINLPSSVGFVIAGTSSASADNVIESVAGTNTINGVITPTTGGNQYAVQVDAGSLQVTSNFSLATLGSARFLNIQGAGTGSWTGNLSNGTGGGTLGLTKSGSGVWTLTGTNIYTGPTTVNGGTLIVGNQNSLPATSAISIAAGGDLQLGKNLGLITLASLSIASGGILDISNNHFIINYGAGTDPIASIAALIVSGYGDGNWDGTGIVSIQGKTNYLSYGIGYADAADPGNPAGLPAGEIEVMYTLLGDANLDGKVNGTDFAILATNFNQGGLSWDQGDFSYDGDDNGTDFAFLATNFNQGSNQSATEALDAFAAANGLLADVPEPASIGLIAFSATFMAKRRRRTR